ncbi:zinc knuckle CX2CX4HX4C containing protein [Tanacetum coccineum]
MKDLVANKQLTEDAEVRMNARSSALLQNLLPPKENYPRSFILPCSIRRLDFNNAFANLGASISIMPFSMFKRLGIWKLEPINMVIEMADDTKCIPKGIVKNLLINIDKFILPIDFVILDIIEDFRMPVLIGRPLLATTHAKVDRFQKTISVEVGNENRKRFRNEYDDSEEIKEPNGCGESEENEIQGTILNKLHDEWFKGTDKDDDDLEGVIDYHEPTLYDRFVDLDNEEYKERKYSTGPGEVYTKIKVSGVEELSRTRGNIATIRARIMDEIFRNDDNEDSYNET